MITVHERRRSTLHGAGARAEVLYGGPGDVRVQLTTDIQLADATRPDADRRTTAAAAGLLCAAVAQARRRRARVVRTVLDASAPSGAALLAALRAQVGTDIADIAMRRAGSSVLVTIDLLPAPARGGGMPVVVTGASGALPAGGSPGRPRREGRPPARAGHAPQAAARALRSTP